VASRALTSDAPGSRRARSRACHTIAFSKTRAQGGKGQVGKSADEVIGGRRVVAFPAEAPHADQHGELQYVLRAHVAPGYVAAVDLLTRVDQKSDFASDVCVRREGVDPQTGKRHLEELAFEVVSEQTEQDVSEKVPRMHRRGVRRIFAIFIKSRQVCEWSSEGPGGWKS
jgi:Putative restriction endonuclease